MVLINIWASAEETKAH